MLFNNSGLFYILTIRNGGLFIMSQSSQDLLTVDELADALKVKKSWVYGKTRETGPDAMPRIRAGKYLRFEYEPVLDWLRKNSTEG
jgi:hypothetical protein